MQTTTNAMEPEGCPFTFADANQGTQRRIGTNVSGVVSRISGGER
ncbi:hypothetical protein CRENPOLYSF2_110006 [Crenothrix polyspora]|uniref:Uncharacterized protein n=1 Tax=Crenothrix polyspora TaxID=360316 RepID=A0A1R4GZ77_9GAMM|nr:hypothetical protein CRENPOLYSF2_110006 [Crenothrix polyspora]